MFLTASLAASLVALTLFIVSTSVASARHKPCHPKSQCEVPEVPWTLVLPAATFGTAGLYYVVNRVRSGRYRDDSDL
jgi:hypothetical protein